jgi:Kazal-type serine protease inhibitor domain
LSPWQFAVAVPKEVFEMRAKAIFYILLGLTLLLGAGQAASAQTGATCGGIGGLKCPEGQACQYPVGQCNTADLAGTCVPLPKVCPHKGPLMCGCDGQTYANECELLKAGVRPDKKGACGKPDKEPAVCKTDADCSSIERGFCEFRAGKCAAPGRCAQKPEICTFVYAPVCGCDNKTYGNDCERRGAGVSLKSTGACPGDKKPAQ